MQVQEREYPNAICGTDSKVLKAIHKKENSIAICKRDIHSLSHDLSSLVDLDFTHKSSGTLEEIDTNLASFFAENLPQCNALLDDIRSLVQLFQEVVRGDSCRLLFSTVSGNMCRKFHTDINDLRLLCTYIGEGTLWVAEDENNKIVDVEEPINENRIHQADAGDILILKGALHPEGNPVLHRSPAIEATRGKRLLLRLDTNNLMAF